MFFKPKRSYSAREVGGRPFIFAFLSVISASSYYMTSDPLWVAVAVAINLVVLKTDKLVNLCLSFHPYKKVLHILLILFPVLLSAGLSESIHTPEIDLILPCFHMLVGVVVFVLLQGVLKFKYLDDAGWRCLDNI